MGRHKSCVREHVRHSLSSWIYSQGWPWIPTSISQVLGLQTCTIIPSVFPVLGIKLRYSYMLHQHPPTWTTTLAHSFILSFGCYSNLLFSMTSVSFLPHLVFLCSQDIPKTSSQRQHPFPAQNHSVTRTMQLDLGITTQLPLPKMPHAIFSFPTSVLSLSPFFRTLSFLLSSIHLAGSFSPSGFCLNIAPLEKPLGPLRLS